MLALQPMYTLFSEEFVFDSVETAVAAFKRGELIVVMDDETRENEGDLLMAAEFATPEQVCTHNHTQISITQHDLTFTIDGIYDKANKWYFVCTYDSCTRKAFGASSHDHQ